MREKSRNECFRRVRSILRSESNARNRIDAINFLALLVVTYANYWNRHLQKTTQMIGCSSLEKNTKKCTLLLAMQKNYLNEISLSTDNISENSTTTEKAKQFKIQVKTENINEMKEGWKGNPLHGKYPIRDSNPDVSSSLTHLWLALSGLNSETEGFIITA